MTIDAGAISERIVRSKAALRRGLPDVDAIFAELETQIGADVDEIVERAAGGAPIVPEVDYRDIVEHCVPATVRASIHVRGCVIVRNVFSVARAQAWNAELTEYLARNAYVEKAGAKAGLDTYFRSLGSGRPQIFGIYWSKPQIAARQSSELARTRTWLNSLWSACNDDAAYFNADRHCTYADRIRCREPADRTLGLSPHMDGGSVERWIDPAFQRVYRHVFGGEWQHFDPFDAAHRTDVREIPSPAVCRMFRTYQGWTALTEQGPRDGTLQVLPIARAIAYMLLRPLVSDVPADSLCGAQAGRALGLVERWHAPLAAGMISIPRVFAGDTVWWHPDLLHGVEDENAGTRSSNVMYISSAPDCAKNRAFLALQQTAFLRGASSPDFAAEDYEVDFTGRATFDDLNALGREQMGFAVA